MEQQPFVAELLVSLSDVIKDLKVHQVNMFYESVALMIRAEGHQPTRDSYLVCYPSAHCSLWHFLGTALTPTFILIPSHHMEDQCISDPGRAS